MGPIVIVGGCATCESALCIHATIDAFSKPKLPNIRYDVSKSLCDTRAAVFPRYGYVDRRSPEEKKKRITRLNIKNRCSGAPLRDARSPPAVALHAGLRKKGAPGRPIP